MREFHEKDVNRDEEGQFSKQGEKSPKSNALTNSKSRAKINSDKVAESDDPKEIAKEIFQCAKQEEIDKLLVEMPKSAFGFSKDRLHTKDHERHVKEMGFKTSKEYERAAIDFWEKGDGDLCYSKRRQVYYKYDKRRRWFLSIDKEGTVRTFHLLPKKQFENRKEQDECLNLTE